MKWIPFYEENKVGSCSLVFKLIQGTVYQLFNKHFTVNNQIHTRNTGYANFKLVCPKYIRETEGGKSFLVRSCRLWNNLPLEIRRKDSFPAFKKCLWNTVIFKEQFKLHNCYIYLDLSVLIYRYKYFL